MGDAYGYGARAPLTYYPNRLHLVGYAALYLALGPLGVAIGVAVLSALSPPYSVARIPILLLAIPIGVIALLTGAMLVTLIPLTVYRLLARTPSLTVSEDGLRDGCSLVGGGLGLLRWDEITAIMPSVLRKRVAFILVIPRDVEGVLARQGPIARVFRRALNFTAPSTLSLPQWLLGAPATDVYARILAEYGDILSARGVFVLDPDALPAAR